MLTIAGELNWQTAENVTENIIMNWLRNRLRLRRQLFLAATDSIQKKHAKQFAEKAKAAIESGIRKMGNEASETKEMAKSFYKLLEYKLDLHKRIVPPTEEEVREAIEQLKDVGRLSVFSTAVILPGGAISLIGLEILAKKFGIKFTFIPSSFRKNAEWKYPGDRKTPPGRRFNRKGGNITDVKPVE